jgi:hypothetical protein
MGSKKLNSPGQDRAQAPLGNHSNGTIGCSDPDHGVNEPPPPGLSYAGRVRWIVDHAPPLTEEQRNTLAVLIDYPRA